MTRFPVHSGDGMMFNEQNQSVLSISYVGRLLICFHDVHDEQFHSDQGCCLQ